MSLTVKERAETLGTFRFIQISLMETLARWTPTTPEMEVKILFGRHIWEVAQHADILGKRTYELRAPMHFTQEPTKEYIAYLKQLSQVEGATDRLHAFYDVALPALARRYESFLAATDSLLDAPSVKVVRRILGDIDVMRKEADDLRQELPALSAASKLEDLTALESNIPSIVIHRQRATVHEVMA